MAGSDSEIQQGIARALGPTPLDDARYLLPPLPPLLPDFAAPICGPHPGTEFVIPLTGGTPVARASLLSQFDSARAALEYPRLWARPVGRERWLSADEISDASAPTRMRLDEIVVARDLGRVFVFETDIREQLGRFAVAANGFANRLGRVATLPESIGDAAARALDLQRIKHSAARNIEMRLLPAGRPFPARDLWRALYSLGLTWGDWNLFHWDDVAHTAPRHLFTVSGVGDPGYFLPERAVESATVAGIALGFELPACPAPLVVFDRMSVALAFLREKLGGRAATPDNAELDSEQLWEQRTHLELLVKQMADAGIMPGLPETKRFF